MQNENKNKTYDLKIERTIAKSTAEVFRAISEGRLFLNCGADQASLKIDFKVGGRYTIHFASYGANNGGEFLEIIPNQRIVFTWCQDFATNSTPDTQVSIDLKDLGDGNTALTIVHSGFSDLENKDNHLGGWTGGLTDLQAEMVNGKLRMLRKFPLTVEKLFLAFQNEKISSLLNGKTVETTLNKKMVAILSPESKITLLFDTDDDHEAISWLELIHEGLKNEAEIKSFRTKWDELFQQVVR